MARSNNDGAGGIDAAISRLEGAVDRLERSLAAGVRAGAGQDAAAGTVERERLAREVSELKAARAKDEALRSEAAAAVKAALEDLRALMPEGEAHV